MATMYQKIQELAKKGRPPAGHGPTDPVTGLPTAARSKVGPQLLAQMMVNDARKQMGQEPFPTEATPVVNQQIARTPEQQAQDTILQENQDAERRRKRGRASTMLSGSEGLLTPNVSRRSLMGF